ncbi:MAG: rRNA cytosine-C5-methyltransferase [Candidatus Cryptobacteroides sp.]
MDTLSASFRKCLEEAIGRDAADVAFSSFDAPPSVSVRLNPFKPSPLLEDADGHFGCSVSSVPWSRHGRILSERPDFTLDPLLHAGAYYVQDSSSMFVGEVFREMLREVRWRKKGQLRVLDLCAAPGGKSTDLLASLREICGDEFLLVSNEVMSARVSVLADNLALWGDSAVAVTNADPSAFSALKGFFDIIVADVPCSGEGMFRKDPKAAAQWSPEAVSLCQSRQRRIVADVWPALAPGGVLIYSTCTFNRRENDENVLWIAESLGAVPSSPELSFEGVMRTGTGFLLVPGFVPGEGQFCAALVKDGCGDSCRQDRFVSASRRQEGDRRLRDRVAPLFSVPVRVNAKGDALVAVPEAVSASVGILSRSVRTIRSGCMAGTLKGDSLVPDADLALSVALSPEAFPKAALERSAALSFLHRDNVALGEAPRGYVAVCYGGLPLGFVKNLGNRCNNLHPQGRRIRMDIK